MSLVLIWPSTVIRSNDSATAAQRVVGIGRQGIGLHEAEHRGEARLDHPRALRLGGDGHATGVTRAPLRPGGPWS